MLFSSLSVFFPAYNEEGNIDMLVRAALAYLPTIAPQFEIIIVNDGSTDHTADISARLAKEFSSVRLINHPQNQGYGAAVRTGFQNARNEWIFFTDGDNQFDIREMDKFLPLIADCDIINPYRTVRKDPLFRRLNAFGWNTLARILFKIKVRDINCAFKLYRKTIVDKMDIKSAGAMINVEMLARAQKMGARVREVGVTHYPRKIGTQTGANLKVIGRAFYELFKLYKEIK